MFSPQPVCFLPAGLLLQIPPPHINGAPARAVAHHTPRVTKSGQGTAGHTAARQPDHLTSIALPSAAHGICSNKAHVGPVPGSRSAGKSGRPVSGAVQCSEAAAARIRCKVFAVIGKAAPPSADQQNQSAFEIPRCAHLQAIHQISGICRFIELSTVA